MLEQPLEKAPMLQETEDGSVKPSVKSLHSAIIYGLSFKYLHNIINKNTSFTPLLK
jgi:hypothetical protein